MKISVAVLCLALVCALFAVKKAGPAVEQMEKFEEIAPGPRREHPCVFINREDVIRARKNSDTTEWGKKARQRILAAADQWLTKDDAYWLAFLPEPGDCYAYGITGCPVCGGGFGRTRGFGLWGEANCNWDRPRMVECSNCKSVFPNSDFPDEGSGFRAKDGRSFYFLGIWNSWVVEQWQMKAVPVLAQAYSLTGDGKYATRCAFFLDLVASIYPESTAGSWDYPSSPPSGRLARPWYQVSRVLHILAGVYDLIYEDRSLDEGSLRPRLEMKFPAKPWRQRRTVESVEGAGFSRPNLTRRENIDRNLMLDGAYYCYSKTFDRALNNGHADYLRGALAVGALLNIPEYVHHAVTSPASIGTMIANNIDRDGEYYETSLLYSQWTRPLYLTFIEPLRNWRDAMFPKGIDLFRDSRLRGFYQIPDLRMRIAGHVPTFGDTAPDDVAVVPADFLFSETDYQFAEYGLGNASAPARIDFLPILSYLSRGNPEKQREETAIGDWLLFHAGSLEKRPASPAAGLEEKRNGSWFLGQKGIAILRDGRGENAQGALLRFGPSLNHGHLDDLGLLYYGKGWQLTYDLGYGLASTHTEVGWARQTSSHTLVTVDERSQGGAGSGSGGSLYLFAALPGLKLMEADSPLSYADEGVSEYRRTVGLIGEGRDQVLVDIFRVQGGSQHDYLVGTASQDVEVSGINLGPEEPGSLAGSENAWGEKILDDGDVAGHPNEPYWNPPPGNGYGFFYAVRRGSFSGSGYVDWNLGGPLKARFRIRPLADGPVEAMVAKAPGLYPQYRKAGYLLLRRKGNPGLKSAFVALLEPRGSGSSVVSRADRVEVTGHSTVEPVGVHLNRLGTDEYLFSAGLDDGERSARIEGRTLTWKGACVYLEFDQGRLRCLGSVGAGDIRLDGVPLDAQPSKVEGTVTGVNPGKREVGTSVILPRGISAEALVSFSNPRYSRATAFRIRKTAANRIDLGDQTLALGRGVVRRVVDARTIENLIPHEYNHSVLNRNGTRFFQGKTIVGDRGAKTRARDFRIDDPSLLDLENAAGFKAGEGFTFYDIAAGDHFVIPLSRWKKF